LQLNWKRMKSFPARPAPRTVLALTITCRLGVFGQVNVIEGEGEDHAGTGGVLGGQSDDEAVGPLLGGAEILLSDPPRSMF
jgi:hypothetical protein